MKPYLRVQRGAKEIGKKSEEIKRTRDEKHMIELYEHAPIGIVECSLDGNYTNVNEEFCRIIGHKKEELLGLDVHAFTNLADVRRETNLYQELVAGRLPFYNSEQRYVRGNGASIWVGLIRSLVRDEDGKPLYTIGIVQDIHHRKVVQEILRKSEDALQQKNIELENACRTVP